MDENEIKILVLKLMQVERLLRELRKKKKSQALIAEQEAQRPKRLNSGVRRMTSRVSSAGSRQSLVRRSSSKAQD